MISYPKLMDCLKEAEDSIRSLTGAVFYLAYDKVHDRWAFVDVSTPHRVVDYFLTPGWVIFCRLTLAGVHFYQLAADPDAAEEYIRRIATTTYPDPRLCTLEAYLAPAVTDQPVDTPPPAQEVPEP